MIDGNQSMFFHCPLAVCSGLHGHSLYFASMEFEFAQGLAYLCGTPLFIPKFLPRKPSWTPSPPWQACFLDLFGICLISFGFQVISYISSYLQNSSCACHAWDLWASLAPSLSPCLPFSCHLPPSASKTATLQARCRF